MAEETDTTASGASGAGESQTFTQEQVNKFMAQVRRETEQKLSERFAGYEEYKTAAQKLAELEEAKKSEDQKTAERLASLERALAERDAMASAALRTQVLTQAAAQAGVVDVDTVVTLLSSDASVTVKDGQVKGVADALAKLLESKPFLRGGGQRQGIGQGAGGAGSSGADMNALIRRGRG